MKAKRFVEAVGHLRFAEVLDDADFQRVKDLFVEAVEQSADHALVGFRVRGHVVLIFWAVLEVIPPGPVTDKDAADLAPDLLASSGEGELSSLRLDGFWFSEGPTAELADLDEAKPPGLEDAPAVLFSYPGRVSWEKLRQTSKRLAR